MVVCINILYINVYKTYHHSLNGVEYLYNCSNTKMIKVNDGAKPLVSINSGLINIEYGPRPDTLKDFEIQRRYKWVSTV